MSAVLVVGYSYGYFTVKDLFKVGAILTVVEWLIHVFILHWRPRTVAGVKQAQVPDLRTLDLVAGPTG